ncbi:inorganic phosphate transporter Pho88 [Spinellus fusiger]|nr:inorganic phosphate transporter Pho88 [Spinellus fusiger]
MVNWNKTLNHPLFNVVFFLATRQATKYLSLEDHVVFLRGMYISAQLIIFALSLYLIRTVKTKNEPAGRSWDGTDTEEQLINITVQDYDVNEITKTMKQSLLGIAMIGLLHLKFNYIQPLIIQSIMGFKTFLLSKEARIHFWGETTTTGELKRPFRVDSPFGMANEKMQPKTDKGSIKKAGKANKAA